MSIQTLSKATLVGLTTDKAVVLDRLQSLGLLHVIPLSAARPDLLLELPEDVHPDQLQQAIRYLLSCPQKRKQVTVERHFDLTKVVMAALENRKRRLDLQEQLDFLRKRIRDLEPWGSFELPGESGLLGYRLWFYLVPNYRMSEVVKTDLPWSVVHRDNRYSYVAVVSETEPRANQMPVPRTHTGSVPLSQLRRRQEDLEIELEALDAEREALTRWLYLLQRSLAGSQDRAECAQVGRQTLDAGEIFAIQGWFAADQRLQLEVFAQDEGLALVIEPVAEGETPPTLLANPESMAGGEEIVRFYQMPGYRAWDPSRVVFFSFAAFFALILSDAGYALLLGAVLMFYWTRMGESATGRRLRALGTTLTLFSAGWGVLVGSYFGAEPPAPLAALKILDMNDFDSMMQVSVIMGAGHLVLANLISAWRHRANLQMLAPLGWVLLIVAGVSGWLRQQLDVEWGMMVVGMVLILFCSSDRPWFGARNWLWRLVDGLLALTGLSKMFGDVLSYLRLFALGLASASLAITFNQLASDVAAAVPGMGLFLEVLILLLGHLLNFVLAVVSGVIHGLRLNLIEFYNWSLADEGYAFQPFTKREVNPWIT
ncbi:V-type ATP synthase subunit I [Marinobacterium sediminicola]|uniref:V/A-type H+-transporting ATPase subunit I n=1 Tax=Marinobacterium sediminicola TaxID=518898 RepID=A0ABY1S0F8_9GAMM|nr:V-type ATP synthase subunit I [Marinobacterium sediminicola]ULG69583.1 V-type ATP synthase subunit I [Marinobacterium sediminicola]SMR74689.1 V/A-type H+-transporting ATPase subunit I [Marinobacterium sediminicola]